LPSSLILKHKLKSVEKVLSENQKYISLKDADTLCQDLAREAFFGKDVMEQCTPEGKYSVGLPRAELMSLKATMFNLFPKYRTCPTQFKAIWKTCVKSIKNSCWHIRNQPKKKL